MAVRPEGVLLLLFFGWLWLLFCLTIRWTGGEGAAGTVETRETGRADLHGIDFHLLLSHHVEELSLQTSQ